jgi:zinc carboxypeptidase
VDLAGLLARVPDFREFLTLEELGESSRRLAEEFPALVRREIVGTSTEGRPIELLTVGHGSRPVLLVGVPHPNEPIGTLTIEFLCRLLCEDAALRAELDVTLSVIKVADPDGFVLNEGWFKGAFSPLRYALEFYRPPHREQVEWSFPVRYKTLVFETPTAETRAVMDVMRRVRPSLFYSLHNAGFCGVYFYLSHDRPGLVPALHRLVESQGLPLHRGEPEVPYLETIAPAVYALFGIDETYDYMAAALGDDPAPHIDAGTSSDDWLRGVCDAFSLVCELPYYTSPILADTAPAGCTRREAVRAGLARAGTIHAECARDFEAIRARVPDHRLTRSVATYLEKTPARLTAEGRHADDPAFDRPATRAEALDATTCRAFHHLLYQGEVHRLAVMIGEHRLADDLRGRLAASMATVERESRLAVLPLRPLVAVQAGAALVAL